MTYQIDKLEKDVVSPVGTANPTRGAGYHDAAVEFIKSFPIGTELTAAEFDGFAISHDLIKPPTSYERSSDGWQAFLQRRHQAKINLNKAGSHPRMIDCGSKAFSIMQVGNGRLVVKSPYEAAVNTPVGKQVESLVETKKKALRHLLQSVDYAELPPVEQSQIQNLYETLEDFKAQVEFSTTRLSDKFDRLRVGVEKLVKEGKVLPQNGAIKGFVSLADDKDVDVIDEEKSND